MANGKKELILDPDKDTLENFPPGQWARDGIDNAVYSVFDKARSGLASFTMSGAGKGALVTALGVALVGALVVGTLASVGWVPPTSIPAQLAGAVPEGFTQGAVAGLKSAGAFLMSGLGVVTLAAGAAFGAVSEERTQRQQMETEMAAVRKALAKEQAKNRSAALALEQEASPDRENGSMSHVERLQMRRDNRSPSQGAAR